MILKSKELYLVRDNLDQFQEFFSRIARKAYFTTHTVTLAHILSDSFVEELSRIKPLNLVIALHEELYEKERIHIQNQCRTAFGKGFFNFLLLSDNTEISQEDTLIGKTHCFVLSRDADPSVLVTNFMLYTVKIFNEATLSDRLQDYIINTVESIVDSEMLKKKKQEVEQLNAELKEKNRTDTLTNLYNRQAVFEVVDREMKRMQRNLWRLKHAQDRQENISRPDLKDFEKEEFGTPIGRILEHYGVFSVMMIDVDYFKRINDTYGHLMGDTVLKTIGELLNRKSIFRETDILGRFGGEEFIGIFPDTGAGHVKIPAQRFKEELKKHTFTAPDGSTFHVTASIGISEYTLKDRSSGEVVTRADKALYWAKEHGRDQITVYEDVFVDSCADAAEERNV